MESRRVIRTWLPRVSRTHRRFERYIVVHVGAPKAIHVIVYRQFALGKGLEAWKIMHLYTMNCLTKNLHNIQVQTPAL